VFEPLVSLCVLLNAGRIRVPTRRRNCEAVLTFTTSLPAHRVLGADRIQNVIQAISRIPIFHKDHVLRDETIGRRREYYGIAVQQK
jgi:hypothetical protein